MTRLEKRLWIFSLIVFIVCLSSSVLVASLRGVSVRDYASVESDHLRTSLRPEREPRKVEKVVSLDGIQTLSIRSTATMVNVTRDENRQDLAITLEGRFVKTNKAPLVVEKKTESVDVHVDEGVKQMSWAGAFDDASRNGELTLVLPRRWAGKLKIETVSADTEVTDLSLGELEWTSVSGAFDAKGGEMHVARLTTVSGDIEYDATTIDCSLKETSGDAMVSLHGIEQVVAPKADLQTVSGRIDLAVPAASSFRISLSSFTGETTSTVPLKKSMPSAGALEGQLGAGGGELRLRSVSGSVHLSTF